MLNESKPHVHPTKNAQGFEVAPMSDFRQQESRVPEMPIQF